MKQNFKKEGFNCFLSSYVKLLKVFYVKLLKVFILINVSFFKLF
ncbi:hypothetical protein HMPREF1397_01456 [Helicobacter pylori GAM115Ai]|nr:hypothetical protein HMPREF1397_01456 [Helicobacter pylori GAM115Ai]